MSDELIAMDNVDADATNAVVQLCAAGMAIDGDPAAAHALFLQAWNASRDEYEAGIAAHFLARHQPTAMDRLHWNRVAAERAGVVTDGRADQFLASLYLNLADSWLAIGNSVEAAAAVQRAFAGLELLPPGGYHDLVARGLQRLQSRIAQGDVPDANPEANIDQSPV